VHGFTYSEPFVVGKAARVFGYIAHVCGLQIISDRPYTVSSLQIFVLLPSSFVAVNVLLLKISDRVSLIMCLCLFTKHDDHFKAL